MSQSIVKDRILYDINDSFGKNVVHINNIVVTKIEKEISELCFSYDLN